jgi:hypothetical protein
MGVSRSRVEPPPSLVERRPRRSWNPLFLSALPEEGLGSCWLKDTLKQRPPAILMGVARAVIVLVLECAYVVGGEVVAATTRALAGTAGAGTSTRSR